MAGDALIHLLRRSAPTRGAGARLYVAFSGGLDSTVLLHALARAGLQEVVAVHVHHGLQSVADDWAAHCEAVCRTLDVPLHVKRVRVRSDGRGLEAAARAARYEALEAEMRPGDVLVTAHHRGDQAETVLLNLMRGSGPSGLSGMAMQRALGPGFLWRPFLETSRDQLSEYARRHALRWIDDPHNREPRFARSFLRIEILPRLAARWPSIEENLGRAAALAAESADLLRELADADLEALIGNEDGSLTVTALVDLSCARRRNVIRRWVQARGLSVPGHDVLAHLERDVLGAAPDATPVLAWRGGEFRRHRARLYALPSLPPVPDDFSVPWDGRAAIQLPSGCGLIEPRGGVPHASGRWTVRMARPSDRFRPQRSARTRTLKNLFQECGVPTWVRERTPLLTLEDNPVWVGGFGWTAEAPASMQGVELAWRHDLPGARNRP